MRNLSKAAVISRLEKSYPGFEASVIQWDSEDPAKMRISAEDGLEDRNGDRLFEMYGSGERTFGVISHLHRWLDRNGWACEWINMGEMHLWKKGENGW
jgi:hypothetical protein